MDPTSFLRCDLLTLALLLARMPFLDAVFPANSPLCTLVPKPRAHVRFMPGAFSVSEPFPAKSARKWRFCQFGRSLPVSRAIHH
jgi:hypothetical protein